MTEDDVEKFVGGTERFIEMMLCAVYDIDNAEAASRLRNLADKVEMGEYERQP